MTKYSPDINLKDIDILVVEDDPVSSLLLSRTIAKHGARVQAVSNGSEALARLAEKRYPVIVTDIRMPDMDGLELVKRIRQFDTNIQIIATSAHCETGCLITAIELGFNDYLLKPVEYEKLLWSIKRCADTFYDRLSLENEQKKFQAVVESLGEGITIKDLQFRIQYQNKAMTTMFGDRIGSACYQLFGHEQPCPDCPTLLSLDDGLSHSACRSYTINDTTLHIESTASVIRDSRGEITGTVEIIRDISERIINEQTIRDLAFHDPLTGLANRRLFEDRLEQAIAKSRRYGMNFGLLTLDLDNFKDINDTFGHEGGDQVLREASERIKSCCKRDLDTISRQGGDEFCIIFTDCGDRERLAEMATKLREVFAQPFIIDGYPEFVTTSIGISMFPENGGSAKELEIASDRAMYAAKKAGRDTFRFWEPYDEPRARFEPSPTS